MSKTHLIIAGHGLKPNGSFDAGATGHITKGEHRYMVEDLFPAMKKYAKDSKDTFVFHTAYKVLDRGNLAQLAKQHNADTATEYHYDAFTEKSKGGHVIIHESFAPDALDLRLRDVINDMIGLRFNHRGHQGIDGRTNLGMVNTAKREGVNFRLVELGFGTNKREADIMVNDVDEYARKLVEAYDKGSHKAKPNAPAPKSKPSAPKKRVSTGTYTGGSIVDYLNRNKISSSFANRKKLAKEYLGISNYSGTAKQNTDLLNAMRKGKPKPKATSKWNYKGGNWTGGILRQGDYGPQVKQLQEKLARKYFYPEKGAKNNGVDSYYGAKTKDAVRRFQLVNGLAQDGIAGPATYRKLK